VVLEVPAADAPEAVAPANGANGVNGGGGTGCTTCNRTANKNDVGTYERCGIGGE